MNADDAYAILDMFISVFGDDRWTTTRNGAMFTVERTGRHRRRWTVKAKTMVALQSEVEVLNRIESIFGADLGLTRYPPPICFRPREERDEQEV